MNLISVLLIVLAVVVIASLVFMLMTQLKSNRHIESLKENIENAKSGEKPVYSKPKVMRVAEPAEKIGIRVAEPPKTDAAEAPVPEATEIAGSGPAEASAETVSGTEADTSVLELVTQIEEALPELEAAAEAADTERLASVLHKLEASASSLGEGGVADLMAEFSTYCESGDDPQTLKTYLQDLRYHAEQLKSAFGA